MLGIFFILLTSFFENVGYKKINSTLARNFSTFLMLFFSSFTMFFVYILFYDFSFSDFAFLSDYKFFILLFLEILVVYFFRENYNYHKENFVVVNMFIFSTIFIMPLVTYYYNDFFDFNSKNNIDYKNIFEAMGFSGLLFLLWLGYFYDKFKIKSEINYKLLFILLLVLINVMYFSIKMIQTYNGFVVYFFIDLFISILFLISAFYSGENINTLNLKKPVDFYKYGLFGIAVIFAVLSALFLAVEFVTIFKRVGQIIAGVVIDKKKIANKDLMIISLIAVSAAIFYIYKQGYL